MKELLKQSNTSAIFSLGLSDAPVDEAEADHKKLSIRPESDQEFSHSLVTNSPVEYW
ncbi:hypothetical protein [Candidatus Colwellia aromaticivorans]|uniref:hypothetical protein n=1 Tax=Candidatus Colwellia aromaticivorans TaxID=2267621 RepID=UPI00144416E8|nr:hypothetical protein [Candidatus Colwellia aromaticivorans]